MVRPAPTLAQRARGALLGHAVGNALALPTEGLYTPAAIAVAFPGGVTEVHRRDTSRSPHDDDVALMLILAEGLAAPEPDFEAVARGWIRWMREDGRGVGPWTRQALGHIAAEGVPLADARGQAGNGALARCIPVALRAHDQPRNLIAAALAQAALTHPDPRCLWSSVAVTVAAARFLEGHRDFLPDVLEALRANGAHQEAPEVFDAANQVPLLKRREELPLTGADAGYTVHCMQAALWAAYHERHLDQALMWLASAGGDTDTNCAVAGGLLGARDGDEAIPARWIAAIRDVERITALAERLVARPTA